jgi:cell wall-associated NlpC family hydrolase
MDPNTSITFSYLDYGDLVNDYWTNHPDPRWYGYTADDGNVYWIASGLVNGNPPSSQLGSADRAIAWAINQQGRQDWDGYCEAFVEIAYGTRYQYGSAQAAYNALHTSNDTSPDIGALVWFSPNAGNGGYGHVGIYIGQNQFISATDVGVKIMDLSYWSNNIAPYEGWGDAPSTWPGSN